MSKRLGFIVPNSDRYLNGNHSAFYFFGLCRTQISCGPQYVSLSASFGGLAAFLAFLWHDVFLSGGGSSALNRIPDSLAVSPVFLNL